MIRWIWFMLSWYTETAYKPYHSTQQKTLFQPQNSPLGDTHRMASITGIVHAIENDRLALFNRLIDGETKCVRYVTSHITSASLTLRNQISKNKVFHLSWIGFNHFQLQGSRGCGISSCKIAPQLQPHLSPLAACSTPLEGGSWIVIRSNLRVPNNRSALWD